MRTVYKGMTFNQAHSPATAEQIAAVEASFGVKLPDDYCEFLRHVNGGVLERPVCVAYSSPIYGEMRTEIAEFRRFFSVDPNHLDYLENELMAYGVGDRIPDKVVPIAVCLTDNPCCMSLREHDYGRLYIWDPENLWAQNEDYPIEKSDKDLRPIVDSFAEFLDFYDKCEGD